MLEKIPCFKSIFGISIAISDILLARQISDLPQ